MPKFRFTRTQTIFRVYELEADDLKHAQAMMHQPAKVVSERIMPEVTDLSSLAPVGKSRRKRP